MTERRRDTAAAIAVYGAALVFWFWPLLAHFGSAILGGPGDGTLSIRVYSEMSHETLNALGPHHDAGIGAPQGESIDAALTAATPLQAEFVIVGARVIGVVAAWNLFTVLAFVGASVLMFVLLRMLRVGLAPALLGGYVYAFNPWQFEKAIEGHAMLAQSWLLPLLFIALLRLHRSPTPLAALGVGAAVALAFYTSAYYLLFAATLATVFAIVATLVRGGPPMYLWPISGVVALLLITPFALYATITSDVSKVGRSVDDLQRFGAEPIEYVVPSPRHPVFGRLVSKIYSPNDTHHFAEPTLFFGLTTIALAVFAVICARRRIPRETERWFVVVCGVAVALVAFVMSLPRTVSIGSASVPMPAWAIGHVTTLWRVYARFAIVVGFALVLLAAIGADELGRRTRRLWPIVAIAALAAFELAVTIPVPTWSTSPPSYVTWLAHRSRTIVAEYPMLEFGPAALSEIQGAGYFRQSQHHQRLYNVFGDPYRTTLAARAIRAATVDLAAPATPGALAAEGVRYVVVHDDVYRRDGFATPRLASGLAVVWQDGPIRIARVSAQPAQVQALVAHDPVGVAHKLGALDPATSFVDADFSRTTSLGWLLLHPPGRVEIVNPNRGDDWVYDLHLEVRGQAGDVELTRDGHVLAHAASTGTGELTLGPFRLRPGRQELMLRSPTLPSLEVYFAPETVPRLPDSVIGATAAG